MLGRAHRAATFAFAAAVAGGVAGCGAAPQAPTPSPVARAAAAAPPSEPVRWLAMDPAWIERGEDGHDRVVTGGRRMELDGMAIAQVGPAEPEVDGGARAPAWTEAGPARYVFWKGRKLYGAATFTGALRPLAKLPAEPRASFDWMSGTGIIMQGGVIVVPPSGGPLLHLGVPAATRAIAADARRALAISAFGRAHLTTDGGATWRDASADLAAAAALEVRGDEIVAVLPDGRQRFLTSTGAVVDASIGHAPGPPRGRRPLRDPDPFPGGSAAHAFDVAVRAGLVIDGGGVVAADRGFVGRLDREAHRTTSIAALDPSLAGADCAAFQAVDGPLLACVADGHAAVVDLTGAPRIERTFDFAGSIDIDRFTGVDGEALGYLGSCAGKPEIVTPGLSPHDEPYNASRQRTAVFCVRSARDTWTEHRLDVADAADVIAWIPRVSGGAVALVARPGAFLDDRERIQVRGALRVVRVARTEPPLAFSPYGWAVPSPLDRSLRVSADDVIEGWLAAGANGSGPIAVTIDAAGHPRAWPAPPRLGPIVPAGRFALARAEDGKLWETIDSGHRWAQVEPPPGSTDAQPSTCSPVGCRVGPFVRLGWSGSGADPVRFDGVQAIALRESGRGRHVVPPSPVVRLACAFEGAPESRRIADSAGFGYTPTPVPRGGVTLRVGTLGMGSYAYSGPQTPLTGDLQLGWVAPLDVEGKVRRAALPISLLDSSNNGYRTHEVRLGWMLAPDGGLDTFPVGAADHCGESLLVAAGIARRLGRCAPDGSVAVDLGGRVVLLQAVNEGIAISASSAPTGPAARARPGPPTAAPVAPRELARTRVGSILRGFSFGVGARAGSPVAVGVDVNGDAVLVPVDPDRGTLGVEEKIRPLSEVVIGSDAACAPRPDDARVVLPFEGTIEIDRAATRSLIPAAGQGVAVIRWSRDRACLDAVEVPVRDERFEDTAGSYEAPGSVRKLVARFAGGRGAARAALISVSLGTELRQRLSCKSVAAK